MAHLQSPYRDLGYSRTAKTRPLESINMLDHATLFRASADFVVVVHAAFVVFVVAGALLALRWPRIGRVHVPAAAWGAFIEFRGWICPLTPLENYLRQRGGSSGYQGEFLQRHLLPVLYPVHLTRPTQIWLGSAVIIINILLYSLVVRKRLPPGDR
jgi:uncharacterized membrane protein YhhN